MKINRRDKLVKHFFGIWGVLDEYKRAEANRIAANAFIFLFWFELALIFLAMIVANVNLHLALYGMIGFNILGVIYGAVLYVILAGHRAGLDNIEVSANNVQAVKQFNRRRGFWLAIIYTLTYLVANAFLHWTTPRSFINNLIAWDNIMPAIISGGLYSWILTFLVNRRVKNADIDK